MRHPALWIVLPAITLLLALSPTRAQAQAAPAQDAPAGITSPLTATASLPAETLVNCPSWQPPASTTYRGFPAAGVYPFLDWPHLDPDLYPWIAGGHQIFPWNSVENAVQGQYYWEEIDQWLATEAILGKPVGLRLNSYDGACCGGDRLPAWFKAAHGAWPAGDGYVTCSWSDSQGSHTEDIPMYWSAAYQQAFEDLIRAAAERYRDDPRLAFIEISTGIYGETMPGESDDEVDACLQAAGLTADLWIQTIDAIVDMYQDHWHDKPLLLQYAPWYLLRKERREITDHAGSVGVGLKYNKMLVDHDDQVVRSDTVDIHPDVCRTGQYDPMLQYAGQAPLSWEGESMYFHNPSDTLWSFLNALNKHPAYLLVGKETVQSTDPIEQWALRLAQRYAGRTVADTPGVWVALRETLSTWYPQRGNFDFWLRQLDSAPGGKSVAAWNITTHPWGRYTRRTDQNSGNPTLAFAVDDAYLFDNSPAAPVTVTVIYLDAGGDTWELQYDAAGADNTKVAGVVQKGSTSQWKEATFALPDAQFANQQPGGADFRISSRGDGNEYVSFVEVSKGGKGGGEGKRSTSPPQRRTNHQSTDHQSTPPPPANDDFDSATVMAAFPFSDALDTSGATTAGDDPAMGCGDGQNRNTVWYRFVAPGNGFVALDSVGSNYDTVLAAWQGDRGSLAGRGCNDDTAWWADSSHLNLPVSAGQTYFVEVASRGDSETDSARRNGSWSSRGQMAASPSALSVLRASFHTCTYASDEATILGILSSFGVLGDFDTFIDYAPATNGGRCAIVEFRLLARDLTGSLPSSLGNLSNLQRLFLHHNRFSGPWPASIGNLSNLYWLDLRHNWFSGPLPSQLSDLSQLQALELANNELSGSLPEWLGDLASLQHLYLSDNQLSGSLPGWLGSLTNLQQLWLGYNQFTGPLPDAALDGVSRLRALSLAGNQLSGPLPANLGQLPALQYLYLSDNQFSGPLPESLSDLASARGLFLDRNQISGPLPESLDQLGNLELLHLEHNQLSGALPAALGSLPSLSGLFLDHNMLSGALPASLGGLAMLQGFYVNDNQIGGPLPDGLGQPAAVASLRRLALNSNQFSGPLPTSLANLDLWLLHTDATDLCEPGDAAFQAWLAGIRDWQGAGQACALSLSKQAEPLSLASPGVLTYTLAIRNTGPAATSVVLTDTLPNGASYIGAEPPAGAMAGQTLTWNVGNLPPGGAFSAALRVLMPAAPGRLVNRSAVRGQAAGPLAAQARFTVDAPLWADLNGDGRVDVLDIALAAERWQSGLYTVVEVQRVAGAWGE